MPGVANLRLVKNLSLFEQIKRSTLLSVGPFLESKDVNSKAVSEIRILKYFEVINYQHIIWQNKEMLRRIQHTIVP